jgi:mono/diheme cytochrome c family protein
MLLTLACCNPSPDQNVGSALVTKFKCASCHGADLSGSSDPIGGTLAYAGNLTPDDATGLGTWTDDQILAAVRNDPCTVMPSFPLSETEATSLVAYLRSIPPVANAIPMSDCARPAPPEIDDAGLDDTGVIIITSGSP